MKESNVLKRTFQSVSIPLIAVLIAIIVFIVFCGLQGAGIDKLYAALYYGMLANPNFITQTLVKAVPLVCAALAVIIPARAGLVNVGGEGQLVIGAVAGTGTTLLLRNAHSGWFGIILTMVIGAVAGGFWGLICAWMKTFLHAPEAVTTLLMNFVATDIMLSLLYSSWKDPDGSGQPQTKPLPQDLRLTDLNIGVKIPVAFLLVIVVGILSWLLINRSSWGFASEIVGRNSEAAFREGLSVPYYSNSAMFIGGLIAGLGGTLNILGAEGQLRPGVTTTFGFIAFLAAFIAKGSIIRGSIYALIAAAVLVASNPLQLRAGLDGNASYVLMGVTCLAILIISQRSRRIQ